MKNVLYAAALTLFLTGAVSAQEVTKKDAVKTTKIAQAKAGKLQQEAKMSGNKTDKKDADKTMNAAKRAEKQAKKNTP